MPREDWKIAEVISLTKKGDRLVRLTPVLSKLLVFVCVPQTADPEASDMAKPLKTLNPPPLIQKQ